MAVLQSVGDLVATAGVVVLAVLNAALAAVTIRFYRIRMDSRWATALYAMLTIPLLYAVSSLLVLGALGVGTGVTLTTQTLYLLVWALPLVVGASIEVFWMYPPSAYERGAEGE